MSTAPTNGACRRRAGRPRLRQRWPAPPGRWPSEPPARGRQVGSPRRYSDCWTSDTLPPASRSRSSRSPACQVASPSRSMGIASRVGPPRAGSDIEPVAQERSCGIGEEVLKIGEVDVLAGAVRAEDRRPGAGRGRGVRAALAAASACGSKLKAGPAPMSRLTASKGCSRCRRTGASNASSSEVPSPRAKRAASMTSPSGTAGARPLRCVGRHRCRSPPACPGRADGVEEQLAVFAAHIAFASDGMAGEGIITVDGPRAGKSRRRARGARRRGAAPAHRDHRADGEAAGPEVGAGQAALGAISEQRADVGDVQQRRRSARAATVASSRPSSARCHASSRGPRPARRRHRRAPPSSTGPCRRPGVRLGSRPPGRRTRSPVPRGRSSRCRRRPMAAPDAPNDRVPPSSPRRGGCGRVRPARCWRQVRPGRMACDAPVQPPTGPRTARPNARTARVVFAEREPSPDRDGRGESRISLAVIRPRSGRQAARQRRAGDSSRCATGRRAGRAGRGRDGSRPKVQVGEPERRLDERREGLDVRAHDEGCRAARAGVVGGETDEHVTEDFDLPGRAVAGVDLDAPVVLADGSGPRLVAGGWVVGGEIMLKVSKPALSSRLLRLGPLTGARVVRVGPVCRLGVQARLVAGRRRATTRCNSADRARGRRAEGARRSSRLVPIARDGPSPTRA